MTKETTTTGKRHDGVFTSPQIVRYMLDMAGYVPNRDLSLVSVIEPSCGNGEFVLEIISRICLSAQIHGFDTAQTINSCLVCYDTDSTKIRTCLDRIQSRFPNITINENLFRNEDFLTAETPVADLIIGNPPYVRYEQIPSEQKVLYKQLFSTFRGRADIYVPFFEKSLRSLQPGGKHCFLCSNRWLKNQYGHNLRQLIASSYHLHEIVNLETVNPFQEDVIAYPAITLISRTQPDKSFLYSEINDINTLIFGKAAKTSCRMPESGDRGDLFSFQKASRSGLTSIENLGFKIGIGVATGADKIFIRKDLPDFIENELLLPVLTSKDVRNNRLDWSGNYLFNPFTENGKTIDLSLFPKAKKYLESYREKLESRHISRKKPSNWYRTIDRVHKELLSQPKILLPDISANNFILIDSGHYYPHHNLYYITGGDIDGLKVLSAVLMSDFVVSQLSRLSNNMNGGYPRWQSQYIRKLKIPDLSVLNSADTRELMELYDARNLSGINALVNGIIA